MTLITTEQISGLALELFVRAIRLPATVSAIGRVGAPSGGKVIVRVPQPVDARTQSTRDADITFDDTTEVPVTVDLAELYIARRVSAQELAFDVVSFGTQILRPMVAGVATGAENQLCDVMNNLNADASFAATFDADDTMEQIAAALQFLAENDAPDTDLTIAVSPAIGARMWKVPLFVRADQSGSDQTLRRGRIGSIGGAEVVQSNGLTAGTAVAYHRSGFVWANETPPAPLGGADSSAEDDQGIGLRTTLQWIPEKLSNAVVVHTFAGAAAVTDDTSESDSTPVNRRYYKIDTAAS